MGDKIVVNFGSLAQAAQDINNAITDAKEGTVAVMVGFATGVGNAVGGVVVVAVAPNVI